VLTGATVTLAAALLTAQTPQRPQSGQVIRASTDIFTTDLHVRDANGRFVPGLTASDFEVYENGIPQKISYFVSVVGGRAIADAPVEAAPVREGVIMPRRAKPPELGRIFIIFLDDLHIQHSETNRTKQILAQIRDTVLHENDLVGIVSSGFSSIAFDLSPDPTRSRFNQAIDKFMGSGKKPIEIIQSNQTTEGPSGLRHDAYVAFRTAYEILAQAERVKDRRKAFIYISSGYDFNPYKDARYKHLQNFMFGPAAPSMATRGSSDSQLELPRSVGQNPFEMYGQQFAGADLAAAITELVSRARRANTVFYTLDPRGLPAGPDIGSPISMEEFHDFIVNSTSSLEEIAIGTGGKCICRTNDVKDGLQRIDNEMSDYYILGYEPSDLDPLRIRRRIEIKSKRPEVRQLTYVDWYDFKPRSSGR
jgi:VWFA-related protein